MVEIYLLVSVCILIPFSIGWLFHCVSSHKTERIYDEFYSDYAERKHAFVVNYTHIRFRTRNDYSYRITLKFVDEDSTYHVTLKTNHHYAKRYEKVKEDDFLCLYGAIKNIRSTDYIDSRANKKLRIKLHGIPLVVLPTEENFVRSGMINRFISFLCIIGFFVGIGILLLIVDKFPLESISSISQIATKAIPFISILIPIVTIAISKFNKR